MQYLLMLRFPPGQGPQEGTPEFDEEMRRWGEIKDELKRAGAYVGASGLHLDATTTVRSRGGELTVTDGPYAETKEALTGYYVLECADLEEAVKIASMIPAAWDGAVEVRPVIDFGS